MNKLIRLLLVFGLLLSNSVPGLAFEGYVTSGPFAGVGKEPVTLRILGYTSEPNQTAQKALIAEFQAKFPNIRIVEERVPASELPNKQIFAVASGDPPDVMYVDGPHIKFWAYNDVLLPLDDFYTEEELADFFPEQLEEMSYQGRLYSPPERESSEALFYNVDMLRDTGIQPPRDLPDAWTWYEALEAFKKVTHDTTGDGVPDIYGFIASRDVGYPYPVLPFARSNGEKGSPTYLAISPDMSTVKGYLDTPEAIEGLQFYQDLFQKWKVSPVVPIPEAFETGAGAFYQSTDFTAGLLDLRYPDINWSITPMPYFKTPITHRGSMSWTVLKATKHPKEAAFFVKWMTDPEQAYKFWQISQQLPARKSVYERIAAYQEFPRDIFYKELLHWGQPRPQTPAFKVMEDILKTHLTNIAQGANVAEQMRRAVQLIDAELAQYR